MYTSIDIDREKLTIMGVQFSDLKTLESTANAISTNMFEGYVPSKESIQLYVDCKNNIIPESEFLKKICAIYGE